MLLLFSHIRTHEQRKNKRKTIFDKCHQFVGLFVRSLSISLRILFVLLFCVCTYYFIIHFVVSSINALLLFGLCSLFISFILVWDSVFLLSLSRSRYKNLECFRLDSLTKKCKKTSLLRVHLLKSNLSAYMCSPLSFRVYIC